MKILHLISGGDTGGAKTHIITLLKKLRKTGLDASILCVMDGEFAKETKENGIPTKIIEQTHRASFKEIREIKKYIKNEKFDLVHCHGARANYIAFFIKKSLNIPFITTLHSDYKLDFKDNIYKNIIFTPINYFCLKKFDHILTVTNSFRKMLISRKFNPKKLITIYNGIDFDKELNPISKKEFLEKYGLMLEKDKVYIGIIARLQTVKGIKYFLQAANELVKNDEKDKLRFLIAGSGTLEKEAKDFIKKNDLQDKVKMLGFVKDIASFYNTIDINVLASLSESFPYSLLEGARQKKATVATAVGGIPEMIKDGETGYLLNPKDWQNLAKNIRLLADDSSTRQKLGQKFYEFAFANFSDTKMADTHINIYKTILKEI